MKNIKLLIVGFSIVCISILASPQICFADAENPPEYPAQEEILTSVNTTGEDQEIVLDSNTTQSEDSQPVPQLNETLLVSPETPVDENASETDDKLNEFSEEQSSDEIDNSENSTESENDEETSLIDLNVESSNAEIEGTDVNLEIENSNGDQPTESATDQPEIEGQPENEVITENLDIALVEDTGGSASDPYWKVGTTTYRTVTSISACPSGTYNDTCFVSATPINLALTKIAGGLFPSDGKLYFLEGTFNESVFIDGTDSPLAKLSGLIGVPSEFNDYPTVINNSIFVYHVSNGFTLSGFEITGDVTFYENNGPLLIKDIYLHGSSEGLAIVDHSGPVKLDRVKVEKNQGEGGFIDNRRGKAAKVEITNSSFNNNTITATQSYGLMIFSKGPVTLNGVSASEIDGDGLIIGQASSISIKNSVFSSNYNSTTTPNYGYGIYLHLDEGIVNVTLENVIAQHNKEHGIYIFTNGRISLKKVDASFNQNDGAYLDNKNAGLATRSSVSIIISRFNGNGYKGMEVYSGGNVTVTSIAANYNADRGVALRSDTNITVNSIKSLGLNGANSFNSNGGYGLFMGSTSGSIYLENFDADNNGASYGVWIKNNYAGYSGSVTIKSTLPGWVNSISGNDIGLNIDSHGTISVNGIYATNNRVTGIYVSNKDAVSAKTITISNTSAYSNSAGGIKILSRGNISLTDVSAGNNLGTYDGIYIQNNFGSGNVLIKTRSSYGHNYINSNSGHGLNILTNGSVTIQNTSASYNAIDGLHLGDVVLLVFPKSANIKSGEFIGNTGNGINAAVSGNISLYNITSNSNTLSGAVLDNCRVSGGVCMGSGTIMISGSGNEFSSNGKYGINAESKLNITVINASASSNLMEGIYLHNDRTGSIGSIIYKTSNPNITNYVSGNGGSGHYNGIKLFSNGTIIVQDVYSTSNSASGIYILNSNAGGSKSVSVIRAYTSNSYYSGLVIDTRSPVTITDVSSNSNRNYGIYILSTQNVTINCTYARGSCGTNNNQLYSGLYIDTDGSISVSKYNASGNGDSAGDHGIHLISSTNKVTITNIFTQGNYDYGLMVSTSGNISLKNITSNYNDTAVVLGSQTNLSGSIYIGGENRLESNGNGLVIWANGAVSINNVVAYGQTWGSGLVINSFGDYQPVVLKNITATNNYLHGIAMTSCGKTDLINVVSLKNGSNAEDGDGLRLYNDYGSLITIRNSVFSYNSGNGIELKVANPYDTSLFKLYNVSYLGNDSNLNGSMDIEYFFS